MALRVFPVDPAAHPQFAQRFGTKPTEHHGTDIFAPTGTAVRAVDEGELKHGTDPKGGTIATVKATDGTRYYYAHLSAYEGAPRHVAAGDVIGFVGTTGNAQGKAPHLHFEVHPQSGGAVDPFPELSAVAPPNAVVSPKTAPSPPAASSAATRTGLALILVLLALSQWRRRG